MVVVLGMYQTQHKRLSDFSQAIQAQLQDTQLSGVPGSVGTGKSQDSSGSANLFFTHLNDLTQRVAKLETQITQTRPSSTVYVSSPSNGSSPKVKESVFFLGSGSTSNRDWTEISAAQIQLDTNNFTKIKEVRFEAGLSIIGGEAHARLVNQTDSAPFYTSEVLNNTNTATWQTSSPLILPTGSKSYTVQLKSTSGETAILEGARIRIIIE
jgi:hypothetical protein